MSELLLPETCQRALAAIEADPLDLPEDVQAHLRTCLSCREARVLWLAQEEAPAASAPHGYFMALPQRVLRKLPAQRMRILRRHPVLWLAAAGLALALGVGGYLVGRVKNAPVAEATLAQPAVDLNELTPESPFDEGDDALSQLADLSPKDVDKVLQRLESAHRP